MNNFPSSKNWVVRHGCAGSWAVNQINTMKSSRVARIGRRDYAREELPPTVWRQQVKALTRWVLLGLLGWTIYLPVAYLVLRL